MDFKIENILNKVEKPARYIGMEKNSIKKDFKEMNITFAFGFPDLYEIAMSNLGMHILYNLLNSLDDIACERVFAPDVDMEKQLRLNDIPLFSLENKKPIGDFDFLGFTLQYELSYTNIINMLDLSHIPIWSSDRSEEDPIVIAGGPCVYNPEPLAEIIDLFVIGEGEEIILELMDLYRESENRSDFLYRALDIEGVYVPKYYRVKYKDNAIIERKSLDKKARDTVKKRIIRNLDSGYYPDKIIVPYIDIVHDKIPLELFRGCTHGCRFCQAGMIYRPIREKSYDRLLNLANELVKSTGYEDVSLTSLSSCDYSELKILVSKLMEEYEKDNIGVSLPSIRIDSFSFEILEEIEKVKRSGLTFAPEAGSQRLRNVINKGVNYGDFTKSIEDAFRGGWSNIKLYFMLGLPTEKDEDVLAIKDLGYDVRNLFFNQEPGERKGNFNVTISTSCFVPKAFTPFQWEGQTEIDEFERRARLIKNNIFDKKINYDYHHPKSSLIEGIISRGDRKIGKLLVRAWENGAKFDGWSEHFKFDVWLNSSKDLGIDMDYYTYRKRSLDEVLPWDFIDIGVKKEYLKREYEKALKEELTQDCRKGCTGCGVNESFEGGVCLDIKGKI